MSRKCLNLHEYFSLPKTKRFKTMNGKEFVKWVLAVVCGLFVWGFV